MSSKKLSKNIVIYGISNGLKSLVPFIMLPILTSYISADGYGVLSLVETTILLLSPFVLLNLEAGINVEYFKSNKPDLAKYLSNGILLSLGAFALVSILFFGSRDFISTTLNIPVNLILLLPIFVLLRLIPTLTLVLYQAQQRAVSYLLFSLFQTGFDFALSAAFIILWNRGYIGRLEGTYIAFFMATIVGGWIIYRMGYFHFTIEKEKVKQVLRFGLPLIPHAVGATIIAMSDRYFISVFESNTEVGLYTAAYQVGALMLLFSRSVNQAWVPMLYGLLNEKNYPSIHTFTLYLFGAFMLVATLIYAGSDLFFEYLIDPSYLKAKSYVLLLLLGFVFQSVYFLFTNFIFYQKRTDILAIITFSGALLNLLLNYLLIQRMGVEGVAYATAITWFVFMVTTMWIVTTKNYLCEKNN